MTKYYITNEIYLYDLEVQEGQVVIFEMPSFCSGDYRAEIYKDNLGFYIDSKDNHFQGCRDFEVK